MNFASTLRIALAVLIMPTCGCANFGNVMAHPEADLQAIKVVQTSSEEIRLLAVLVFHNPNPLTLQLTKIDYHLWLDRVSLLTGSWASPPLIRNRQDQSLEIPLVLKTSLVMAALPPAKKNGERTYRFSGRALAGNSWVPTPVLFEDEGSLVLPQMPATRWADLRASKDGQKPEFGLEITNPNAFPIAIRRLQGQGEFENFPYTWEFRPKGLSLAPQQTKRVFLPCQAAGHGGAPAAAAKISAGEALTYWLQGELECTSPQGIIMVVIHEKGMTGKKN